LPLPPFKRISQAFTFFQAYALAQPLSPMAETPVIHLRLARQCHTFDYIFFGKFIPTTEVGGDRRDLL